MNATTLNKPIQTWRHRLGAVPLLPVATALLLLGALRAPAAITLDTASFTNAGANASSVALPHTVNPDPTGSGMLVVSVAIEATVDRPVSAVTYGSQSLVPVPGSRAVQFSSATYNATEQWYLPAPAAGTATLTVTFPGAVANGTVVGAVSLFGVNQAAPEAVAVLAGAGGDGLYSLNITTLTAGAWLVDVVNNGSGGATGFAPGASQTERWDMVAGAQIRSAGSTREVTTAGTVANTWTCTAGTSREAHSISAFAPAPPAPVAVTITSPAEAAVVSTTSFAIITSASVNPGTVTNVDFYVDAALAGNDTSFPFSYVVSGAAAGAHTLEAVAWDNNGNSATSTVVNITAANLPPSVSLTSPANGSPVLVGASVSLTANASDDATVTNVDFYVDGSLVGSDDSSPYNGSWASATLGAHALTAVAWDNGGLSTTSAVVNITGVTSFAAYEPFNYALGSLANGTPATGGGFTGNWTCGTAGTIVSGMTYPGLPTANNALSSTGGRQSAGLLAPLSGGTEYVSFLFTQTANNGANYCGVYFPNGGTGLFFGYGFAPGGSSGALGLGSMNTVGTAVQPANPLAISFTGTYGTTYLVVMQIDFNTSGANDTVTVYINPTANSATPPGSPTYTVSSFDVGTISGIGLTMQGGGQAIRVDEIRRGGTYGEVVGYNPPATPTGLVANAGINSVSLNWNVASGATGYNVLRGTSTGIYDVTNSVASNTNYDATAVGGTTYFYVVQATNSSGPSAYSSEVTATPTIALPSVPTGLTATGTNSAVQLTWNPAAGAAGYNVKRSTTSGTEVTIASVGTTGYSDTAVVNGQQYFYKVSSTNSAGESADSAEVNATPDVPPATPTGLAATAGTNEVVLSWTASAGATSYNVKRSITSGSGFSTIGTTTAPTVTYTDSTAVKFTQYFYVVSAVNANGESGDASEVNATPLGTYGPLAYEPFNYPLGALADNDASTGTGFSGVWTVAGGATIVAGLTYSGLTVADNALASSTSHHYESLTTPQGSGSVWVSVLFQQAGDNGGNRDGFVMADASGNGVEFAYQQYSGVQGLPALMAISGFSSFGGQLSPISATPQTYNTANLYVFQLSYSGGALTSIDVYSNPTTGANVPPAPDFTVSSGLGGIGALSVLGMAHQAGISLTVDEWKVGQVYGDVVGYTVGGGVNTTPTNIVTSVSGDQLTLSWPADYIGWTLQSQTNSLDTGLTGDWSDVAGSTATNQMTFTIDPANPTVFFRMILP